jgi:benzoyl-CoA reductase/2-hydroxyglutaryl-CoA dehydratase subunit BcrC/BadD/HgdB
MERIGFTTTLPIEAIMAAGHVPIDLNNAFIKGPDTEADIRAAETAGFPRSMCAWIKGIYGTIKRLGIRRVVGVLEGDCSYTEGLMDVLEHEGYDVIGFHFPHEPDEAKLKPMIADLAVKLGVSMANVEKKWAELRPLRENLRKLDEMTITGQVSGAENFGILINASDFEGDAAAYAKKVQKLLVSAEKRRPKKQALRLAVAGIPPAFTDLFTFLEKRNVQVVYNEMPVEFAMLRPAVNIAVQYSDYTYPYPFRHRLERIRHEIARRKVDGIIHYVQTFCYRGIHDRLLKEALNVPVLPLEGDRPAHVGGREELRLESFIEMLLSRKNVR